MDFIGLAAIISAMGLFVWRLVKTFLKELRDNRAENREALRENRAEMYVFLNNHLSGYTRSMERLADQTERLTAEAERAHSIAQEMERERAMRAHGG